MRALLVVVVAVVGCGPARLPGAPEPGSACAPTEPRECMTAESIGLCVERTWREWPCNGTCSSAGCELQMPTKEGEPCAPGSIEGGAVACIPVDGGPSTSVLKCIGGVAKAVECGHCTTNMFGVACD